MTSTVEPETAAARCNLCGIVMPLAEATRWHKDGFDIVECPECGLLFRAKLPDEAEVKEIYGVSYFAEAGNGGGGQGYPDYLADQDVHRALARRRLRRLVGLGARGPLLDVGCAGGFFLDEARSAGWGVEGVDISEPMADYARTELGLQVRTGLFGTLEAAPAAYGCITMWDYIEHSIDPLSELGKARSLLADSGVLGLSTGDAATLVARISGSRWHLLTPRHHNYFFTMATLHKALAEAGFEIVWAGHPGARYTLRYLVHKLRTAAPRSRALAAADRRIGRARIGRLAIPMNLWDIATVVARPATAGGHRVSAVIPGQGEQESEKRVRDGE